MDAEAVVDGEGGRSMLLLILGVVVIFSEEEDGEAGDIGGIVEAGMGPADVVEADPS